MRRRRRKRRDAVTCDALASDAIDPDRRRLGLGQERRARRARGLRLLRGQQPAAVAGRRNRGLPRAARARTASPSRSTSRPAPGSTALAEAMAALRAAGWTRALPLARREDRHAGQALLRDPPPPSVLERRAHADRGDRVRARAARRRARARHSFSTPATCRPPRCATGSRTSSPSTRRRLTLQFESFGFKHGVPLDADLVFDVRCLPNPHYEPELSPLTGRDAPVVEFLERMPEVERMYGDIYHFVAELAARLRARQPQLPDRRDRLHRRPASLRVPRRAPGARVRAALPGAEAPSRDRLSRQLEAIAPSMSRSVPTHRDPRLHRRLGHALRACACSNACSPRGARVYLLYSPAAQVVAKQECDIALPTQPREAQRVLGERFGARDGQLLVFGREDWMAPVASGSQSRRRDGGLPLQHGHARRDRRRPRRQPDRARRRRDAEGAPAAGAGAARDAAVGDPPRQHDAARARRRRDPAARARLLHAAAVGRRTSSTSSSRACSTSSACRMR